MAKKDLDQRHKRLLARLAMGMCGLCGLQMWDMLTMTREAHEFQRLPHPRAFIGNVMADTPDLSGDRRQKAAKRLAEAKEVLDEALELKAAGVSGKGL